MTRIAETKGRTARRKTRVVGQVKLAGAAGLPMAQETRAPLLLENSGNGEVHSVRFHYFDLAARDVAVAGIFNNWQPQPLQKRDEHWVLDLILAPGKYEYRFFIDGEWKDDPMAKAYARNPYGSFNSILTVSSLPGSPGLLA